MKLLNPASGPEDIRAILASDHPDFSVESITLSNQGFDNMTFEVNGQWMLRFAKEEWHRPKFASETSVLRFLKGKTSLRIPNIEIEGKSFLYSAYQKIPGERMQDLWGGLSHPEKNAVLEDLAGFLFEIHAAVSPEQAAKLNVRRFPFHWRPPLEMLEMLQKRYYGAPWQGRALKALSRYLDTLNEKGPETFVHHDVHGANVLLDPTSKKVTGVIDFGDLCIGDIHRDFFSMCWVDYAAADGLAHAYERKSGATLDRRRIRDLRIISLLGDLCVQHNTHGTELERFEKMAAEMQ